MRQIQEDDLQYLQLFLNYAQLALKYGRETPFQDLLFVIRDWPYPDENKYGYSKDYIEEVLDQNEHQTSEMRQLRAQVRETFNNINAFLMPYPGKAVSQSKNFTGNLQQIGADFVEKVRELVSSLFDPKRLVAKKVMGQNVQAQDFVKYLQSYVDVFSGDDLPEPKSILMVCLDLKKN